MSAPEAFAIGCSVGSLTTIVALLILIGSRR
jgi:hypothetical protein